MSSPLDRTVPAAAPGGVAPWSDHAFGADVGTGPGAVGGSTGFRDGWVTAERLLAVVGTVLLALRVTLPQLITVGALISFATLPLWLPVTRRYVGSRLLLAVGVLAVPAGVVLTVLAASDHVVKRGLLFSNSMVLLGALAGFGFLLWARERIGPGATAAFFGIGLLLGLASPGTLYASNPWRFGFSVPVTLLVLALLSRAPRLVQLLAVAVLVLVSALTDARSSFGILLLVAALLAWQMRPGRTDRRRSGAGAILGLGVLAAVTYNVGQAAILSGYLGAKTRDRSLQQLDASGSLILGGRPEITATLALMRDRFLGFGSGTLPSFSDVLVAKTGMSAINYDPNNGYVDNFMFGTGFELHSMIGDLWAHFGLLGILFCAVILVLVLRRVGHATANRLASGLLLYLGFRTLWNLLFSPWYSALPLFMLTLALLLEPPTRTGDPTTGGRTGRQKAELTRG